MVMNANSTSGWRMQMVLVDDECTNEAQHNNLYLKTPTEKFRKETSFLCGLIVDLQTLTLKLLYEFTKESTT